MPCRLCEAFSPPERPDRPWPRRRHGGLAELGYCKLDRQPAHPGYHCKRFVAKGVEITPEGMGLTEAEIAWIRRHPGHSSVRPLLALYRHATHEPGRTDIRQAFSRQLEVWRAGLRQQGLTLRLPITHP